MNFLDKLKSDTARNWDKPFPKASMAVCDMTTLAVEPSEIWEKMVEV